MFQLQYLNSKLNNKHINKIVDNYKIKYSGIKNEIESKINDMIKLFLKDILGFLENIEKTSNEKKKLNNYEKMKNELDKIRTQLKMKTYNEHKIKNELDLLNQENSLLKVKINSLNQKILNLTNNLNNNNYNNNSARPKSPIVRKINRSKDFITSSVNLRQLHYSTKLITNYSKKLSRSVDKKMLTEKDRDNWNINGSKLNNLSDILPKHGKYKMKKEKTTTNRNNRQSINLNHYIKSSSNTINKKNKKINYNKFVNNKSNNNNYNNIKNIHTPNNTSSNTNNNTNNNKKEELPELQQYSPGPILSAFSNLVINNKTEKKNNGLSKRKKSNPKKRDSHNYSPNNSFDLLLELHPIYEDIENNINSIFDEEIKNLEQDEENIKRLLDQLNNLNNENGNELVLSRSSGDSSD